MKRFRFSPLIVLLLVSCNIYKLADTYTTHELKKNKLVFHTLELDKYKLSYWDSETDKPVLILIHGFGTSGKFQWYKEAGKLAKKYRLIIANMLYFGSEPKSPSYTVKSQVDAMAALIEKLNIHTYNLCGSSYGGLVAAELALKQPSKVNKLILMDVPLKFFTDADIEVVCDKYKIENPEELFVPSNPLRFQKLLSITYYKVPPMPPFMIRSFYQNTYEKELPQLHNIYLSLMNEKANINEGNYKFKMPVLLIWGAEDRLVPPHVAEQLKDYIGQNAQLELIPNASHLPNLENEKMVTRLLLDFLK